MLHGIGKKGHSEDLVDLLLACHGRIRAFLALASAIGTHGGAPDAEVADASGRVRRYFAVALPLHVEDEELGILPRLHGRSAEIDGALERMCGEHDQHADPLRRLLAVCSALSTDPRDASARASLAPAAQELAELLEPHLVAEENLIFPAIRERLSAEEQAAIVRELRARRQTP